jgi:hypothetical protein
MDINNYEEYLIYKDGRVFSKKRNIFMKPNKNGEGYLRLNLCKNGKRKNFLIHRLIAEHYIDNPDNNPCIDHIDGNKTNNNISNLRWVTRIENCNAFQTKRINNKSGIKNISYHKTHKYWKYKKNIYGKEYLRTFKNKIDCIWCKFIFEMLNKKK